MKTVMAMQTILEGEPSLDCVHPTKAKMQLIKEREENKCLGPVDFVVFSL